jgi:hypothetical protein
MMAEPHVQYLGRCINECLAKAQAELGSIPDPFPPATDTPEELSATPGKWEFATHA